MPSINERMTAAGIPGRPYTIAAQLDWAAAELDRLEAQLNFSNATITELRGQLEKMAVERDSLQQQLAAAQERDIVLSRGILSVQNLINESRGVDGYHMNGNIAEWGMLLEDGCMLDEYSNALHLIHKITTDSLRKQSDFALITKMESDVADADEKITELEQQLAAAQEREAAYRNALMDAAKDFDRADMGNCCQHVMDELNRIINAAEAADDHQ